MLNLESITVLTTAERRDAFEAGLGYGIDIIDDFRKSNPLDHLMFNLATGTGNILVIDEAHFPVTTELAQGLAAYLDSSANAARRLRVIVVCSERVPGDSLLTYLAAYCQIHDIVYDCGLIQAIGRVATLIEHPNSRYNCLPLLRFASKGAIGSDAKTAVQVGENTYSLAPGEHLSLSVNMELLKDSSVLRFDNWDAPLLSVQVLPGGVAC